MKSMSLFLGSALAAAVPATAATVVFESTPLRSNAQVNGFPDLRGPGSTAVGRLTVSSAQTINAIGVLNYLPTASNLKFLIADATTGQILFLSDPKNFSADLGDVTNDALNYKISNPFSFTFNPGTIYGVGSIADGDTFTFADFVQTNSSGGFTSLLGNINVANFDSPIIDTQNFCCSIGFQLLTGVAAVPEPASWALMIVGFGMVGGAMRRRKPSVSVSYG